jgi:hypothetical protein
MNRIALCALSFALASCGVPSDEEAASSGQAQSHDALKLMMPDFAIRFVSAHPDTDRFEISNFGTAPGTARLNVVGPKPYSIMIALQAGESFVYRPFGTECGQLTILTLDPENRLFESDETNNQIMRLQTCSSTDF